MFAVCALWPLVVLHKGCGKAVHQVLDRHGR